MDARKFILVKDGDTISKYSREYGIDTELLFKWNDLAKGEFIYTGDKFYLEGLLSYIYLSKTSAPWGQWVDPVENFSGDKYGIDVPNYEVKKEVSELFGVLENIDKKVSTGGASFVPSVVLVPTKIGNRDIFWDHVLTLLNAGWTLSEGNFIQSGIVSNGESVFLYKKDGVTPSLEYKILWIDNGGTRPTPGNLVPNTVKTILDQVPNGWSLKSNTLMTKSGFVMCLLEREKNL